MYRVGAIAVHNERLLVEHDSEYGFCFVPGGRVEYGENPLSQALAREVREELGEDDDDRAPRSRHGQPVRA